MKQQFKVCYQNDGVQSKVWRRTPVEGWARLKVLLPSNSHDVLLPATNAARRAKELDAFQELFEDLVQLMCDGARVGSTPTTETRYGEKRRDIQRAYASVRPFLISFMKFSVADADSVCEGLCGDPFLALIAPRSIEDFLALDDGAAISRIQRVRDAIERYQRHLRLLLSSTR